MTEKILTKQLKQVSTDANLGNSDSLLPTQKAVKEYVDGVTLSRIYDVNINNLTDRQFLMFDAETMKWKNSTSNASTGFDAVTGSPYDNTRLTEALNMLDCGTM